MRRANELRLRRAETEKFKKCEGRKIGMTGFRPSGNGRANEMNMIDEPVP